MEFAGRHVVVTGATGALGRSVIEVLGSRGAVCHAPVRDRAVPEGRSAAGIQVEWAPGVDLTDEAAVASFYAGIDGLWASIHCAGGFASTPLESTGLADLEKLWRLNVVTAFLCSREAARAIRRESRGGRIVNVVARAALEPRTGARMAAYTATKAAVAALTTALAEELAGEGIWVNAVAPSILDTPANRSAMPGADPSLWVTTAEVAATVAHLASPRNGSARGALVPVYGRS